MSIITEDPPHTMAVPIPDADIFLFGRGKVAYSWIYERNVPFWFLYYNPEPGACLNFSGRIIRPSGQEILLIPPYTPFSTSCEKPFEHIYVHFYVGGRYCQVKPEVMIFDRSICGTLDKLTGPETCSGAAVYALLFSALAAIPEEQFTEKQRTVDDRIQRAVTLINRGCSRMEICRKIAMSGSSFQRRFREEMNIAPHRYAMQMRMEKAEILLSSGTEDISAIAETCGFSDRYAFSKAFKKYIGVPPAEYRSSRSPKKRFPGK